VCERKWEAEASKGPLVCSVREYVRREDVDDILTAPTAKSKRKSASVLRVPPASGKRPWGEGGVDHSQAGTLTHGVRCAPPPYGGSTMLPRLSTILVPYATPVLHVRHVVTSPLRHNWPMTSVFHSGKIGTPQTA